MTITNTTAGTVLTIAGRNKHGTTKHGLYNYLPVCATIAPKKKDEENKFYCTRFAVRKASVSQPQTDPG